MELYYVNTGGWELCKVFEVISFLTYVKIFNTHTKTTYILHKQYL